MEPNKGEKVVDDKYRSHPQVSQSKGTLEALITSRNNEFIAINDKYEKTQKERRIENEKKCNERYADLSIFSSSSV